MRQRVRRSGSQVVLSWPAGATGFNPEQTATLAPSVWGSGPGPVVLQGTDNTVTVNHPSTATRFYRLRHP